MYAAMLDSSMILKEVTSGQGYVIGLQLVCILDVIVNLIINPLFCCKSEITKLKPAELDWFHANKLGIWAILTQKPGNR